METNKPENKFLINSTEINNSKQNCEKIKMRKEEGQMKEEMMINGEGRKNKFY